ncbi:MAG TPA: SUMF1/EgtB/PvdO family nonheme iron enzyme [Labilithrix sp.]|nr:SUMF1/EgtB/PvdO family nonheme iron enzyme [Labilithrix sp.]
MRKLASFALTLGSFAALVIACSSSADKPPPSQQSAEGGVFEGGTNEGGDATPASCRNTMKDNSETDVDCGGAVCIKCKLGKACKAKEDCDEGAECENKICALCHDGKTNGDETDVDCGGRACGPCTVGKRCKDAPDCGSGACTNATCACPQDMTIIALAGGGAYCIDQSEVSKGQYNKFITANVPVTTQTGACAVNDTFVPRGAWPPAEAPGPLEFSLGLPVHYVDWCDASAYCKWAKKQLCGAINGASVTPGTANNTATGDAWFNACSAQGTKTYPYGAIPYDPQRCNGNGVGTVGAPAVLDSRDLGFGHPANEDDGVYQVAVSDKGGNIGSADHKACQGGSVGVYQMSGNVAEWEDSCDDATATSPCRVRGGSYKDNDNIEALKCVAVRSVPRMPLTKDAVKDIGIRCCLY